MRVTIDAVGIREGGGAAVLLELLRWLPEVRPDWRWEVLLLDRALRAFDDPRVAAGVALEPTRRGHTGVGRLAWLHYHLPRRLAARRPDVLLALANLGPARAVVPQVLFCQQMKAVSDDALAGAPLRERPRLRVLRAGVVAGARASARVVVQTEAMGRHLVRLDPRLAARVRVIPSGYRTPSAAPVVRPEKADLIARAGRPRLLYVSLPAPHKNYEALLRAHAHVVRALPGASLLLTVPPAGADRAGADPAPAQRVRRLVEELALGDHVVFLGTLSPDEVSHALAHSDLLVFPSLAESFGLPLAEAMAAGCPIAAADLPYAHDVAGPAAAYFDPRDPAAVAACLLSLLGDRGERDRLRAHAAERRQRFSYGEIAEQFAQVLESARPASAAPRRPAGVAP